MIKNKKGEVFTLTVLALTALLAFFIGSSKNPISKIFGGGGDQKIKQTMSIKKESNPVIFYGEDGKVRVYKQTSYEKSTLNTNEAPKLTLWQRLMFLPRLWLILMVLGIFFPPVAGIMGFFNRKLWREAKKIVGGVEDSLKALETTDPAAKQKILETLSKKYDSSTKALVSKAKRET